MRTSASTTSGGVKNSPALAPASSANCLMRYSYARPSTSAGTFLFERSCSSKCWTSAWTTSLGISGLPLPSGAGWFQSTVKTPRSSSFAVGDRAHRLRQDLADVRRCRLDVAPARPVGDGEPVLAALAEHRSLGLGEGASLLPLELGDRLVGLVLPLVAEPLVEHQGQDVVLVVLPRRLASEDVCGAPQVGFELLECHAHWRFVILGSRPEGPIAHRPLDVMCMTASLGPMHARPLRPSLHQAWAGARTRTQA